MGYRRILLNHVYWSLAHGIASRSRTAWMVSCGLQDGYDVSRLFRILPDARVLIGVPVRDDTTRDLERSRNAIRFQQRVFPKLQFREVPLIHYKYHIFYPREGDPVAFVGSMNLTANRWAEIMVEVHDKRTIDELAEEFECHWRTAKEVKPHKDGVLSDILKKPVRKAMSTEK